MYEKQTWSTGDVITADKLNHIENGVENGGGYHYEEETKVLIAETTFTAEGENPYYEIEDREEKDYLKELPSKVTVVFDNVTYSCELKDADTRGKYYGADYVGDSDVDCDFSEYPFQLVVYHSSHDEYFIDGIAVQDTNEHTIYVTYTDKNIVVDDDFKEAVSSLMVVDVGGDLFSPTLTKTFEEIQSQFSTCGVVALLKTNDGGFSMDFVKRTYYDIVSDIEIKYYIETMGGDLYVADGLTEYPTLDDGGDTPTVN